MARTSADHRFRVGAAPSAQGRRTGSDPVTVKVSKLFDQLLAHVEEVGFANVTEGCHDEATGCT